MIDPFARAETVWEITGNIRLMHAGIWSLINDELDPYEASDMLLAIESRADAVVELLGRPLFRVRINLDRFGKRMARSAGNHPSGEAEILAAITALGLTPCGDGWWEGTREALRALEPGDVLEGGPASNR
jgi:hypothetical protein